MLSYEDIFRRHSRPVTFLNGHLDSPITRIPTPMIRRSPVAYKERRRPTSIASLDSLHSYREKEVLPRFFNDDHRLGSTDSTSRILNEGFKLPLKENIQRISRYSNNYSPLEDVDFKISSDIHRYPAKDRKVLSETEKYSSKENTPRILTDTYRYHVRDRTANTANTAATQEPDYHSLRRKSPVRDTKSRNFSDNYRHATSFPESHLSRRELPLCSPDELLDIIREPTGYYALPTDPWNEVYPDIYLSDANTLLSIINAWLIRDISTRAGCAVHQNKRMLPYIPLPYRPTALCTAVLKRLGITHVLNAAQGREKNCGQVNTTSGFYLNSGINFLGVPAFDNIVFRIYPYFEQAAQFIDDGLKAKGKVLVHCRAGISRSATLVCAFLMLKKGMTVQEAVRAVRKHRAIIPNDGFLQQLCDLNDKLKRKNKTCTS